MTTFAELRELRKPKTLTVWIPLNADLIDQIEQLEREVRIAEREDERETRKPVAPGLRAEVDKLKDEAEASAVAFTLQELPRKVYRDLITAHPTEDKTMRWDEATFAPALLAAACTCPEMTLEEAQEFFDEWGSSAAYAVFGAAVTVNEEPPKVPFSVRSTAETNGSSMSSTTADLEG